MSNKRLYVGNLPFDATTEDVRTAFEAFGTVHDVSLVSDRDTGRPRGFGFVEMDSESAKAAIEGLNDKDFGGRDLTVNEARERASGGRNSRYSNRVVLLAREAPSTIRIPAGAGSTPIATATGTATTPRPDLATTSLDSRDTGAPTLH